jgi:hypothetical protein
LAGGTVTEEEYSRQIERRNDSFLRDILDNLDQYAFGIITQHGYRELERKLNEHAQTIEDKFHRWFVRGLVAFAVIAVACVSALVGFGIVQSNQGNLIQQVKNTRRSFVRDSCRAQNKRHDKTQRILLRAAQRAEDKAPTLHSRMRIRNNTEVSIALIDALAPVQDCNRLAQVSVGDAKPPPPVLR